MFKTTLRVIVATFMKKSITIWTFTHNNFPFYKIYKYDQIIHNSTKIVKIVGKLENLKYNKKWYIMGNNKE